MRRLGALLLATSLVAAACSGDESSSPSTTAADETTADDSSELTDDEATAEETTDDEATADDPSELSDEPTAEETTDDGASAAPLVWAGCADLPAVFECATLAVPLDHTEPTGATIDIAVARLPASDQINRIGSLVFNPGGPGGSGLAYLELAQFIIPPNVSAVFDLVSFDPRGVGASSSVDCDLVLDDGVELVADDDRDAWNALESAAREQLATCMSDVDELDRHVGTNNAARDLDLLRAAVGDDQLSYVGFSYGTRLGATYAELFPERVRALVLDGAVKPSDDLTAVGLEQAGGFDRAFANFASACDADPDCLLQELGPTEDVVAAVRAEIASAGAFTTEDPARMLTAGELDLGIIASLYSKDSWPLLAQALYLAETTADGTLFQVLADALIGRELDGSYTNQTEASSFINCADDPRRPDVDDVWEQADALADRSTSFGAVLRGSTGCLGIEPALDPLVIGPATGAPPILVIGTTGDPATPYEWSVEMAEALDSGVLYTVEGEGHTAFTTIDCVSGVVERYLIDLVVPEPGSSCVDDAATDFFVPAGDSEFDQVLAFFDCLVAEGAPIDPVTLGDLLVDPTGEQIFGDVDVTDPAFQAAAFACRDLLPT